MRRLLLLACLSLTVPLPVSAAQLYMADYDRSAWTSQTDGPLCHLSHAIPWFGTAVFTRTLQGDLALAVYAQQPPPQSGSAILLRRAAPWKAAAEQPIEAARVSSEGALLRFSSYSAQQVLSLLERGELPVIQLRNWWAEQTVELALSPVGFREGLRQHLACVGRLPAPRQARAPEESPVPDRDYLQVSAEVPLQSDTANEGLGLAMPGFSYHPAPEEAAAAVAVAGAAGAPKPALAAAIAEIHRPEPPQAPVQVYFATDNAGLDRDAMERLREVAARLREHDDWKLLLTTGGADPRGSRRHNQRLSQARADAVRDYLGELGVDRQRIVVRVRGEGPPLRDPSDPFELAAQRRVVLEITR